MQRYISAGCVAIFDQCNSVSHSHDDKDNMFITVQYTGKYSGVLLACLIMIWSTADVLTYPSIQDSYRLRFYLSPYFPTHDIKFDLHVQTDKMEFMKCNAT